MFPKGRDLYPVKAEADDYVSVYLYRTFASDLDDILDVKAKATFSIVDSLEIEPEAITIGPITFNKTDECWGENWVDKLRNDSNTLLPNGNLSHYTLQIGNCR